MRNKVVGYCMGHIKASNQYNETKLEEIKYGLDGIYMLISKLIVILFLAIIFNILKEVLLFLLLYNFIKMPSFGLHATKSWICLVSSIFIFLFVPVLCTILIIPVWLKVVMGVILILSIFKNAPADTHKKPIINKKRREVYKFISTLIAIIYVFCSLLVTNNFLANAYLISLLVQSFIISPFTYKVFNMPYNNYKTYVVNTSV